MEISAATASVSAPSANLYSVGMTTTAGLSGNVHGRACDCVVAHHRAVPRLILATSHTCEVRGPSRPHERMHHDLEPSRRSRGTQRSVKIYLCSQSVDRIRANEHSILVATDAAARGLDIPGVRTVVHYQLPLSAEVYVHRCGRTARAFTDGCCIALISPNDASKFAALIKSFAKESFPRFPVESSYMSEIMKRLSLACQIDKIVRKESQEKAEKSWLERNAKSVELVLEDNDSEEDRVKKFRQKKAKSNQLNKLQQAGVSPLIQHQFEELARQKLGDVSTSEQKKRRKLVVIGQDCVEPLQALRSTSKEACLDLKEIAERRKSTDNLRRKRKEMKKRLHEQRRKQRKKLQQRDV